jgi:galactokinase
LGGSEDHTAILCCRAGQLSLYSFCPVRHEADILFPDRHVLAVAASGVAAEKTGAARELYNQASLAARRIVEIWRASSGRDDATLAAASAGPGALERIRKAIEKSANEAGPVLIDRLEQFLSESVEIIPAVVDALSRCDLSSLGLLVDRSQLAAENLLRNQVPETIALARSAREFGAAAASAFGAGFGGSVWALVPRHDAQEFMSRWSEGYQREFPIAAERASFFITSPGPPAIRL